MLYIRVVLMHREQKKLDKENLKQQRHMVSMFLGSSLQKKQNLLKVSCLSLFLSRSHKFVSTGKASKTRADQTRERLEGSQSTRGTNNNLHET